MKNITKSVYSIGFVMFAIVMVVFLVLNIFFRDVHYYRNSIMLSAFLLPLIFAVGAFLSVTSQSRRKKILGFREAYGRAFMPMFVGGLLSISAIFAYISIDKETKQLLNYQYIDSYKISLEEEYSKAKQIVKPNTAEMTELEQKYAEGKQRIAEKEKRNEDMFAIKYFAYIFAGYCAYFLILSLFLGSFFRTRRSEYEQMVGNPNS